MGAFHADPLGELARRPELLGVIVAMERGWPGSSHLRFASAALKQRRRVWFYWPSEQALEVIDADTLGTYWRLWTYCTADLLKRRVKVGFSGGEKKRNEILQMAMLEPKMCILDETDSGLDVDAMKLVSEGVNALRSAGRSFLVITHYQRLLDHIKPDVVHIMAAGRIIKTGGPELALEVENNGYADLLAEVK